MLPNRLGRWPRCHWRFFAGLLCLTCPPLIGLFFVVRLHRVQHRVALMISTSTCSMFSPVRSHQLRPPAHPPTRLEWPHLFAIGGRRNRLAFSIWVKPHPRISLCPKLKQLQHNASFDACLPPRYFPSSTCPPSFRPVPWPLPAQFLSHRRLLGWALCPFSVVSRPSRTTWLSPEPSKRFVRFSGFACSAETLCFSLPVYSRSGPGATMHRLSRDSLLAGHIGLGVTLVTSACACQRRSLSTTALSVVPPRKNKTKTGNLHTLPPPTPVTVAMCAQLRVCPVTARKSYYSMRSCT